MGAPPPTRTAPMDTCAEERRVMLMGNAWAALTGAAIIRKPESVCSERVRRRPERRRRKFRPETLRHRNGRRRQVQPPRGFWRAVDPHCFHPPKGSGARGRLISQVTGQKGGRRLSRRRCACRLFSFGGSVGRQTALFKLHQELGARIVDFGGWDLPVQYGSP